VALSSFALPNRLLKYLSLGIECLHLDQEQRLLPVQLINKNHFKKQASIVVSIYRKRDVNNVLNYQPINEFFETVFCDIV